MLLQTERLGLRPLELHDADAFLEMRANEEVARYRARRPAGSLEAATRELPRILTLVAEGSAVGWAVTRRDDGQLLGTIGPLRVDRAHRTSSIAFELARGEWGKGYAREAVVPVLRYGFDTLSLHRSKRKWTRAMCVRCVYWSRVAFGARGFFARTNGFEESLWTQ